MKQAADSNDSVMTHIEISDKRFLKRKIRVAN